MKDLLNVKPFLKKRISWYAAYNCSNSGKNNPYKNLFKFFEKWVHEKSIYGMYKMEM